MRQLLVAMMGMIACGGANEDMTVAEPVASQTPVEPLPTMSAPPQPVASQPEPPPPPPPRHPGTSPTWTTVNFVEVRKHPSAGRIDAVIKSAPAWRAFPGIDPVNDLDWMTEHHDDMVVVYHVPDAKVEAAILQVARPATVSVPKVKAWFGTVNGTAITFLRAFPLSVRITPARNANDAAREVALAPPPPLAFHANEALRVKIGDPSAALPLPGDVSEARVWVDSRPADGGADIYADLDCPSPAAAQVDAAAIANTIKQQNTLMVRIGTAGVLNNVDITPDGNKVKLHVRANQQQIESIATLAASRFGSP